METTKQIGDAGEDRAVLELEKSGYKIVARNWRTRFGEIDIVAQDGDTLVFVEVKAKKGSYFGAPAEMITKRKLEKIKRTASDYILESNYTGPWRIDAVLIENNKTDILRNITI